MVSLGHITIISKVPKFYHQVRTHFARPNWKKVLSKLSSKHCNARIGKCMSIFLFLNDLFNSFSIS